VVVGLVEVARVLSALVHELKVPRGPLSLPCQACGTTRLAAIQPPGPARQLGASVGRSGLLCSALSPRGTGIADGNGTA
jgi:hypothetical protein